jgi:hypothetical protein
MGSVIGDVLPLALAGAAGVEDDGGPSTVASVVELLLGLLLLVAAFGTVLLGRGIGGLSS